MENIDRRTGFMRKRRKWNEEMVREILLKVNSESNLTLTYLYGNYGGMVRAIKEDYGSLEQGLKKFGFSYNEINKLEKWPPEKVIERLIDYYKQGILTISFLRENDWKLLYGARECFGSLENASKVCGIPYHEIRQSNIWSSKVDVDNLLLQLYRKGLLTPMYVREHGDGLLGACKKFYGSLENAVEANGVSYKEILQREDWNKEKVIIHLREMYNDGIPIQSIYLKTNYPQIHAACIRHFGSFLNAITSAGFTIEEIYGTEKWNKERIISKLQELGVEGVLMTENFAIEFRPLYKACYREFGSFIQACEEAGLSVNVIKENRPYIDKKKWEKDEVINELYEWFYVKRKSHRDLFTENSKLEKQARDHFGTLLKALNEIDIDYEERWRKNVRSAGIRFENLVGKVLSELSYQIKLRNKLIHLAPRQSIKPDFVLNGDVGDIFVDAKLSAWTQSIDETIEKYKNYCSELWIVYWYNEREKKDFGKVKFKSIFDLIECLPKERKRHYFFKLNELETWLNKSQFE
ncbi:hypothetical protein [Alkalihalobacterium elongatum]|uniref:hypothetical protein n=1 Tax=Alkalihalobacterium elongatum TaxID=2675466 RepID=UPI001C1F3AD5|nr:hypothetical protein [Alkalihalobacterium elongatum]